MKDFYNEMLNDCYGEIKIGYLVFAASEIIERLDPIAYHQGLMDFEDTMAENVKEEETQGLTN